MICKYLEVRDRATCIPVLAISMDNPKSDIERIFLERSGFSFGAGRCVVMIDLENKCIASYDPYFWSKSYYERTRTEAHSYIERNFENLKDGDVIDVEYILGEKDTISEPELR